MRVRLSPHFHLDEFDPHDGGTVPGRYIGELKLLCTLVLEPMRARFGTCTVVSGYRSVAHNRSVGGAPNSHHLYAKHPDSPAADVKFERGTAAEWYEYADKLLGSRGGVGRYPGHVHVDRRYAGARF